MVAWPVRHLSKVPLAGCVEKGSLGSSTFGEPQPFVGLTHFTIELLAQLTLEFWSYEQKSNRYYLLNCTGTNPQERIVLSSQCTAHWSILSCCPALDDSRRSYKEGSALQGSAGWRRKGRGVRLSSVDWSRFKIMLFLLEWISSFMYLSCTELLYLGSIQNFLCPEARPKETCLAGRTQLSDPETETAMILVDHTYFPGFSLPLLSLTPIESGSSSAFL